MPDEYVDALFDDAAGEYARYSRLVWLKAAIYEGAVEIGSKLAMQSSFKQGSSSESLSDRAKAWEKQIARFKKDLDEQIAEEDAAKEITLPAFLAQTKRIPVKKKDYPNES